MSKPLPKIVDNSPHCGPTLNQLTIGACTAFSVIKSAMYLYNVQNVVANLEDIKKCLGTDNVVNEALNFEGSELFVYYKERVLEGSTKTDSGATVRDSMKVWNKYGIPAAALWPYVPAKFANAPPSAATKDALKRKLTTYISLDPPGTEDVVGNIKAQVAAGYVVNVGMWCYDQIFTVGPDGNIARGTPGERPIGGHAVPIEGYNDNIMIGKLQGAFLIQNSWGPWGMMWNNQKGYAWLSYDAFVHGYQGKPDACDCWVATSAAFS